jgi:hypothetical protein
VSLSDDLAGHAAQRVLAVDAEELEVGARDAVEHARVALRGANATDHGRYHGAARRARHYRPCPRQLVVSALTGDAAAGGVPFALAADYVLAAQ